MTTMVELLTMQAPMPSPVHTSPAAILESLRPTTKINVIDLVAEVGVDGLPWHFRADGIAIDAPAENPSCCSLQQRHQRFLDAQVKR